MIKLTQMQPKKIKGILTPTNLERVDPCNPKMYPTGLVASALSQSDRAEKLHAAHLNRICNNVLGQTSIGHKMNRKFKQAQIEGGAWQS